MRKLMPKEVQACDEWLDRQNPTAFQELIKCNYVNHFKLVSTYVLAASWLSYREIYKLKMCNK